MSYYLEVWLRGFAKDHLRAISTRDTEDYHPHITFVRPFQTNEEAAVQAHVIDLCRGMAPISFSLKGHGTFDTPEGIFHYVPVIRARGLLKFDSGLEAVLDPDVEFVEKLNSRKALHATVPTNKPFAPLPRIDQYMLRLTGIRNKRIWFSFDFVTQKTLTRAESLDDARWYRTVHEFSRQYGLLPTRQGYRCMAEPQ